MIEKNFEQIDEATLQALIDNKVSEAKTIEYKQSLPGNLDSEKIKFLADVSSFANASGGDIVYGVVEDRETGNPKSLEGLSIDNIDQEKLRLDNIIREGIKPRIPSVNIRCIPLNNSKVVLLIRVQKSWISPHRVTLGGHDKFYSRSSNGKYQLDVTELRVAFNLSETIIERIKNFRLDRIAKLLNNETPVTFYGNAKIVLHLIPINSFYAAHNYEIDKIISKSHITPIYCSGWNNRYNLDGILAFAWNKENGSHSYVQVFRNGIIEAVEGLLLEPHDSRLIIPSIAYEEKLINSLTEYISFLKTLNVELPILVFLTLLGVKGYSMPDKYGDYDHYTIDRDILSLPEVLLENCEVNASRILKPCFDSIWNACGFPKSLNYNESGEWAPRS